MSQPSPDIADVVAYYYKEAARKEAEMQEIAGRVNVLMLEVRSLRKLAQDTEAQFPQAKRVMKNDGPYLTNMPTITFEELMKELAKKAGRVNHVAERLKISERLVRDLINTPNSRYYIAARGWIMLKPKQQEAA